MQAMLECLACFVHGVFAWHRNAGEIGIWQTPQGGFEGAWCHCSNHHVPPLLLRQMGCGLA
jgi:hypothetical protein